MIPVLTETDLVNRILSTIPPSWFSDTAKAPGGVLYSLFNAWATNHFFVYQGITYAQALTRISTAYGEGLDTVANDYFGPTFTRLPGESDTAFRTRIQVALLQPRAARTAIAAALYKATGINPRMTEPFNPGDTCAFDKNSYFGVDTLLNPSRFADNLPYQGMIDLAVPLSSLTGNQPVYGYDDGCAFNTPQCAFFGVIAEQSAGFISTVEKLILSFKAEGTEVWLRTPLTTPPFLVGTLTIPNTDSETNQSSPGAKSVLQSYVMGLGVFLEIPGWNTTEWISQDGVSFVVDFSVPSPDNELLGWYVTSLATSPTLKVPLNVGQTSIDVNVPGGIPSGSIVIATPSWNTSVYITAISSSQVTLEFGAPAPGGWVNVTLLPEGTTTPIPSGDTSIAISTPVGTTTPYAVFGLPSWNTQVSVSSKIAGGFTFNFSTPAPSGANMYWALVGGIS